MIELLMIFDAYTYSVWIYLRNSSISYGGRRALNEFFIEKYREEFKENLCPTKHMIIDCFFNNLPASQIHNSFKLLFKTIVKLKIPLNKSLIGFPDGRLEYPVILENRDYAHHAQYLFAFITRTYLPVDFRPMVFTQNGFMVKNEIYESAIPFAIDNPDFFDTSKFIALFPDKYFKKE